ncbi:MAG: TonB-dependent receptor [Bacteroidetes bacterium]|nr:TonB-dependent receptor [Bacteroidota bacterium]
MKKIVFLIFVFCVSTCILTAQVLTQTIKGKVIDSETQQPLIGATIIILGTEPLQGATTNKDGNFLISNITLGRYDIQFSYLGYQSSTMREIQVTSGKEVVINTPLKQSIVKMGEVAISGFTEKDKPVNTMALISARSFSVEEARRYAGGMDDPARTVSAFAGITTGSMQSNSIIIRGNSPKGVSWRLEGVEIPNPNHFPNANLVGGGIVTVFSSQMLTNSDFFTSAFPAEYGNALAGVFDMKFRTGNSEKKEHTIQIGVMGIDLSSEGPFRKGGKATYLFNYRYSTFSLMRSFLPKNTSVPIYQDLNFKLHFPIKNGSISIWGIGALDHMNQDFILDSTKWENEISRTNLDWNLKMGAIGITNKQFINQSTFINTTLAFTGTFNSLKMDRLNDFLISKPNLNIIDNSGKIILSSYINQKVSSRHTLKAGFTFYTLFYELNINGTFNNNPITYQNFVTEKGKSEFIELFYQSKYSISEHFVINGGINGSYFLLNKKFSIDPRISFKWEINTRHSISFGFGKHSQIEDLKIYLVKKVQNDQFSSPNINLAPSQALHFVGGYDWQINQNMRIKMEPYYQYLYNIPGKPGSSYSLINFTQDWAFRDSLVNNSKGENIGIDITFEKFLNKGYYYLITTSFFKSKYCGDDGIWRNSKFNKGYVINLLIGKEFTFKNDHILGINARYTLMGGDRFTPVNMEQSIIFKTVIYDESKAYQEQIPSSQYLDITLTYRINKQKHSSVWAIQIKNALGEKNYDGYSYYYKTGTVENKGYSVILPVISYKIEF